MDKKIKRVIEEAMSCLDWDVIMSFYQSSDYELKFTKRRERKTVTKDFIKKELRSTVTFVIESGISKFEADQWIINWRTSDDELGHMLEIIFAPTKGCSFENEGEYLTEEELSTEVQTKDHLTSLLAQKVKEEDYELAAVLRDQIKSLDRRIKQHK